ncbi:hypothetical protein IHE45_12G032700 [Dioscorea alata]|uniref:Uncharacterized protein n=1 Tax=Dioscorea alata TaxID=55571 RepID=A0ACB7V128_DIOAL|nr:hypothetical protein IHE45_12G032700 [Dioscorea alata]
MEILLCIISNVKNWRRLWAFVTEHKLLQRNH